MSKMAEQIEWESLALSLLNLPDRCEIDSEELTYPIAANVFNGVEVALSVIIFMADTVNNERQPLFLDLRECFCEIHHRQPRLCHRQPRLCHRLFHSGLL